MRSPHVAAEWIVALANMIITIASHSLFRGEGSARKTEDADQYVGLPKLKKDIPSAQTVANAKQA